MDRETFDRKYTVQLNPQQMQAVHAIATVVTIRFSKHGEKKFILSDAIERGQLRFAGD